jgi:hypothetical protein
LTEEGIGIIAGSLPSLRPLLNLRIRISTSSNSAAVSGNAYPPASHSRQPPRSAIKMDTFQTLGDNDVDMSDGDSQKNIIKETKYTVTSTSVHQQGSREKNWDYKNSNHV